MAQFPVLPTQNEQHRYCTLHQRVNTQHKHAF